MSITKIEKVKLYDIEICNLDDFINHTHPEINGYYDEEKYIDYWKPELRKVLEGVWGHDYNEEKDRGGYRFMTGSLYFFANYFGMERDHPNPSRPRYTGLPKLTTKDWYIDYALAEMDGFSGFEGDKNITCHKMIEKLELGIPLTHFEIGYMKQIEHNLKKEDGTYKKYMNPQEYLWQHFDKPMGKALYESEKMNILLLTSRRMGKSYHVISRALRGFVLQGARSLDDYREANTKFTCVFGAFSDTHTKENYSKFFAAHDFLDTIGSYQVDEFDDKPGDLDGSGFFWAPYSGEQKQGGLITDSLKEIGGKKTLEGRSKMSRVSYNKKSTAAVGFAANLYIGEEVGTWARFTPIHNANENATKVDFKFGSSIYIGTGGEIKYSQNVRKAFHNPESFGGVIFKNVWKTGGKGTSCFIPTYYHKLSYYDELGNHKLDAAFEDAMSEREKKEKIGGSEFTDHIADHPMIYDDIFMQSSRGYLPIARSSAKLSTIEAVNFSERGIQKGRFIWPDTNKKIVHFERDNKLIPFLNRKDIENAKDSGDKFGAHLLYSPPEPGDLCATIYDPTDHDQGTSMNCVFTFRFNATYSDLKMGMLAEWIGRTGSTKKDDFEAIKQTLYFESLLCGELNNPHLDSTLEEKGLFDIAHPSPEDAVRTFHHGFKNKYWHGLHKLAHFNIKMEKLTGEWLKTKIGERKTHSGKYVDIQIIDVIESEMFHNDIVYYNDNDNFDMAMCIFILATVAKQYEIESLRNDDPISKNEAWDQVVDAYNSGEVYDNLNDLLWV